MLVACCEGGVALASRKTAAAAPSSIGSPSGVPAKIQQVVGYSLQHITIYSRLQVTGYRLQITGYGLQVTGYRLQQVHTKIQQIARQLCLKCPNQVERTVMLKIDNCASSEQCTIDLTSLYCSKPGLQKLFRAL